MIDEATEAVLISNQSRTVTISCPMSLAENWLSRRLIGFRSEHPNIELLVQGTIWDNPEDRGNADLIISMCRHDEVPRGGHRILQETMSLLCAPDIARGIASLPDLLALPRIVVLGRQEFWTAFEPEFGTDLLGTGTAIRTNATNIALELASSGIGLIAAPLDLAQIYVDRHLLVEPFDLRPQSPWGYFLTEGSDQPTAAALKLRNWLLKSG